MHFLDIITDETARAGYKASAIAIAATVTAVTFGYVNIPPEAIEWFLMAAAALAFGAADAAALNKGKEVDIWPGMKKFDLKIRYRDFLRILIILQSPDKIARRITHAIDRVNPGPYYTSVICFLDSGGISVRFDASFLSRLPKKKR